MASKLYRTQILLEPEQHRRLVEIARRKQRSVSQVVRDMVQAQLNEQPRVADKAEQRRREMFERLHQEYEDAVAARGGQPPDFDIVAAINQMREERDADILGLNHDGVLDHGVHGTARKTQKRPV